MKIPSNRDSLNGKYFCSGPVSIRVAGVERSESPDIAISGDSQNLDPSHLNQVHTVPLPIFRTSCFRHSFVIHSTLGIRHWRQDPE
jgi:hypothetical protein